MWGGNEICFFLNDFNLMKEEKITFERWVNLKITLEDEIWRCLENELWKMCEYDFENVVWFEKWRKMKDMLIYKFELKMKSEDVEMRK